MHCVGGHCYQCPLARSRAATDNPAVPNDMSANTISHYRVLSKLGEGGMGAVYRAEDMVLRREVAIKLLHGSLAGQNELRMRLLREARAAAGLSHPNICTIYEVDEVGPESYPADQAAIA